MKHRAYLSQTAPLLDTTDWSRTPLGPPATWPRTLRGFTSMIMAMPTPAIIFWGPELTQIYNDGYAAIMGPRHPRYFAAPYRDCWPDTYPLIYPLMRRVLDDAEVVEVERERIPLTRLGFDEDAYFTFTFSPLRDDDGRIAGILQPVFEVTDSVLAERRTNVLRELSALPASTRLWQDATGILAGARDDLPEALIVERRPDGNVTVLAATRPGPLAGLGADGLSRVVGEALATRAPVGPVATTPVVALPLQAGAAGAPALVWVASLNPRLRENAAYRQFREMVALELSSALERSEAATAEVRQRERLDRLFMQAPAGIALTRGPQHVFELANPMYRALIGHREVNGLPLREALPELVDQPFPSILDQVYRSGEAYVGLAEPALLARKRGGPVEPVHFNFVYQPLLDPEQRTEGILICCYEVTEQVLARQHSERLAEALRLEHQRKDEFLAMLAHELRNPLAPVRSAADLLLRAPGDAPVVERAGRIISRQVLHLAALVNDLLDVSRVTRGLVSLEREALDLRTALMDAAEQVRPLAEARGHDLQIELPERRVTMLGDHKRLVQVFSNLLHNAVKFTPDAGRIDVVLAAVDGHAVVSVADSGVGIDSELLPRVFDLFVQGKRGVDRAAGGLGIGLALARSLVHLHSGRIEAVSAGEGAGSQFRVTLPAEEAPSEHGASAADRPPPVCGGGEPVLVVDDNLDAAQMLALQVQDAGYAVHVAHRGHDAIQACSKRRYLACLVDIGLPDLPGHEVAARLRAAGHDRPLLAPSAAMVRRRTSASRAMQASITTSSSRWTSRRSSACCTSARPPEARPRALAEGTFGPAHRVGTPRFP